MGVNRKIDHDREETAKVIGAKKLRVTLKIPQYFMWSHCGATQAQQYQYLQYFVFEPSASMCAIIEKTISKNSAIKGYYDNALRHHGRYRQESSWLTP